MRFSAPVSLFAVFVCIPIGCSNYPEKTDVPIVDLVSRFSPHEYQFLTRELRDFSVRGIRTQIVSIGDLPEDMTLDEYQTGFEYLWSLRSSGAPRIIILVMDTPNPVLGELVCSFQFLASASYAHREQVLESMRSAPRMDGDHCYEATLVMLRRIEQIVAPNYTPPPDITIGSAQPPKSWFHSNIRLSAILLALLVVASYLMRRFWSRNKATGGAAME